MEQELASQAALVGASVDFSVWGLFVRADWVVKLVMLLLFAASIWSWTIIFEKSMRLRRVRRQADAFEEAFWSGNSLDELYERIGNRAEHPLAMMFVAAMREWKRAAQRATRSRIAGGVRDRVERVMSVTSKREVEKLERYLGFLATVGSTAPFVGLFGTVWGIMNSFQSIALTRNTSLAVVAPGIAEALFATALGLLAAIPAVVAYNKFIGDMDRYGNRLQGFAEEFSAIIGRQAEDSDLAADEAGEVYR